MDTRTPQSFYFRHGEVLPGSEEDPGVTEDGYVGLEQVRSQLSRRGFSPTRLFCSTERLCIESITYLWPEIEPTILPMLHAYGTFDFVGVPGDHTWGSRDYAHHVLNEILARAGDEPFAVCSHDCTATLIGFALRERRGGDVEWNHKALPSDLTLPDPGSGILLDGADYTFFQPTKL